MRAHQAEIKMRQQVISPIAAAGAQDGADIVTAKHFVQLTAAALHAAGEVEILLENGVEKKRAIAHALKRPASCFEFLALDVAGGGNNADGVAAPESRRQDALCGGSHHSISAKNSPLQMILAGPVSQTSFCSQRTICAPPGARTSSGDCARPLWMAATAAAQEPVPEDCVSPTPRSKMRSSTSPGPSTLTNSTLVPCWKSWCLPISAPSACQPGRNSSTKITKCGLPMLTGIPVISPNASLIENGSPG